MNQGYSPDWISTQTLKVIKTNEMVDVVVKGQRYMLDFTKLTPFLRTEGTPGFVISWGGVSLGR